jgi:hypothetical protein
MNDMSPVIVPRSDQYNAEDFLAGPRTFSIEAVSITPGQEQPVSIKLVGEERVWRPCKSMSRCLVAIWGPDAKAYIGRSLTLYNDPKVRWAGMEVGGIRISNMSHMDNPVTMALAESKKNRKPFTVQPMANAAPPPKTQYKPRGLTVSELTNRFASNDTRAGHLAIADDPDVQKALAWLKDNRPAAYASIEGEIRKSWTRTEPQPLVIENAPENDPTNHPDGGPKIEGEQYAGAG